MIVLAHGVTAVLAHGVATRQDLPVPFEFVRLGAAGAILLSFVVLLAAWRSPRFEGGPGAGGGRPLPGALQRLAGAAWPRAVLRGIGLLAAAATVVTAAAGPASAVANPAPTWFYVWLWVGLVPASLLLGPVGRLLNPLRALAAALARFSGDPDERAVRPLPPGLGCRPAAAALAAFAWLELVYPERAEPQVVLIFLVLYALAQLGGAMRWGSAWFAAGDGFEVWSTLLGHLAPVGRDEADPERRLVLRNPLAGLATIRPGPGLAAVVAVVLGATVYDGVSSTGWWSELLAGLSGPAELAAGTVGLAATIAAVAGAWLLACTASARLAGSEARALVPAGGAPGRAQGAQGAQGAWSPAGRALAADLAHSLLPIAAGYTIAHYASLLLWQGQAGYILASDPFGLGWDLFGTAGWSIDYGVAPPATIALIQVGAIVLGHLLGVVSAHDRAVALLPPTAARRSQYPLVVVMVAFTVIGLGLLLR
jgi:hypothetical protein